MSGLAIPDSKDRSKRIDEELVQEGLERERRGDLHSTNEEAAGSRSAGDRMSARDRPPVHQQEKERPLELGEVYRGRVTNVINIGCFVQLIGVSARRQGLVHVSQLENRRVEDPRDVVKREEMVWVKVISIDQQRNRIGLSMKEVDQNTGRPLNASGNGRERWANPSAPAGSGSNLTPLGGGRAGADGASGLKGLSGIKPTAEDNEMFNSRRRKRMSSPERWETKQLIASGVLPASALDPAFEEDGQGNFMNLHEEGAEEEIEIDLNEAEPPFLQGQTHASGVDVSPIKIVKVPDGSLQRAAMTQSALAKERRELKEQQQRSEMEAVPKDLSRPWEDPMAQEDRQLAAEVRGTGLAARDVPRVEAIALGRN